MKPLAVFRIRPEAKSHLSVQVEVFRTVKGFQAHERQEDRRDGRRRRTRGLVGVTLGIVERRPSRRLTGLFATIRIPRSHLTMATITHEAFHATMRWAARRRIAAIPTQSNLSNLTDLRHLSVEERCAIVHDTMCAKMVRQLRRRHLIET